MNTLWLIITFPFWLSGKVWKWLVVYPYLRSIGAHHVQAKHMTFCKEDSEEWTLSHFSVLDDIHYGSEHDVTCPTCEYTHTAKRAWLRGDAWPGDLGTTYAEAKKKAEVCGPCS